MNESLCILILTPKAPSRSLDFDTNHKFHLTHSLHPPRWVEVQPSTMPSSKSSSSHKRNRRSQHQVREHFGGSMPKDTSILSSIEATNKHPAIAKTQQAYSSRQPSPDPSPNAPPSVPSPPSVPPMASRSDSDFSDHAPPIPEEFESTDSDNEDGSSRTTHITNIILHRIFIVQYRFSVESFVRQLHPSFE